MLLCNDCKLLHVTQVQVLQVELHCHGALCCSDQNHWSAEWLEDQYVHLRVLGVNLRRRAVVVYRHSHVKQAKGFKLEILHYFDDSGAGNSKIEDTLGVPIRVIPYLETKFHIW